mmetsp:Transcript_89109/g.157897  ORF Transcript_89109/g.157897 Transcript_89109/m.157897 type:complete len:211 (+) Transcript_89109:343-975(+)
MSASASISWSKFSAACSASRAVEGSSTPSEAEIRRAILPIASSLCFESASSAGDTSRHRTSGPARLPGFSYSCSGSSVTGSGTSTGASTLGIAVCTMALSWLLQTSATLSSICLSNRSISLRVSSRTCFTSTDMARCTSPKRVDKEAISLSITCNLPPICFRRLLSSQDASAFTSCEPPTLGSCVMIALHPRWSDCSCPCQVSCLGSAAC